MSPASAAAAASYRRTVLPLVVLLIASATTTRLARAADDATVKEPTKFVRFTDEKGGGRLETAVVTYKNDAGVELKLVSAIHIGERSYFDSLNKDFEGEDAVLYELVKEKDAPLPGPEAMRKKAAEGGAANANPIGQLQRFLKDTLDLEFQLDVIDYTKKNFVHADMDKAQFEKAQAERGESFETLMLQQLLAAMKNPQAHALPGANGNASDADTLKELVKLVTRPDMERQVKTFIAKQMDQMQDAAMGLDGPGGSVILTERNKAALKVLDETIKSGKKKIALFYGAAHMPDLSKRVREMGFKPSGPVEWKAAWDLHIRADQPSAVEKLLNDFIDALDEPEAPANPDGVF
jgi:hypothetical protein